MKMTKKEALDELQKKVESVVIWKNIVDKAVAKRDPNTKRFMVVFEDQIKDLHKAYDSLKVEICIGWGE